MIDIIKLKSNLEIITNRLGHFPTLDEYDQQQDKLYCTSRIRQDYKWSDLYQIVTDSIYSRKTSIELNCNRCGKKFNKIPSHLTKNNYCSRSCASKSRVVSNDTKTKISNALSNKTYPHRKNLILNKPQLCAACGSTFYAKIKKRSCSETCKHKLYQQAGKKSASVRSKRSKLEVQLFDLIKSEYPSALPNHIISDGWDADIVLPFHKIAILWNGIWHRKQTTLKNHSLKQVQNRDKIKINLFENLEWKVFVFEDNEYTPEKAFCVIQEYISRNPAN